MKHICPNCKTEFIPDTKNSYDYCKGQCGIGRWNSDEPVWYIKLVGEYSIYWDDDGTWVTRKGTGTLLCRGEHLPYDIDEDMIKMLITFS